MKIFEIIRGFFSSIPKVILRKCDISCQTLVITFKVTFEVKLLIFLFRICMSKKLSYSIFNQNLKLFLQSSDSISLVKMIMKIKGDCCDKQVHQSKLTCSNWQLNH